MSSSARKRAATPGQNKVREGCNRAKRSLDNTDAVEVVCRLTPYFGPTPCLTVVDENVVRCVPPPGFQRRDGSNYAPKDFEFGYVFDDTDRQQAVFERCTIDLIEHLLAGKNGLLFTYGITGSGKTYTMTGKPTPEETGLLPRALDVLFNSIDNKADRCVFYPNGRNGFAIRSKLEAHIARKQAEMERLQISSEIEQRYVEKRVVGVYLLHCMLCLPRLQLQVRLLAQLQVPGYNDDYVCAVFVSYVEIYNNYCYDLLEMKSTFTKRDTRVDTNNMVYVEGAREIEVEDSDEALQLFCKGEERRRTSDTILNKESSRSHSVFTIRLVMAPSREGSYPLHPADADRIIVSQLSLVDLAGSERAKRTKNVGDRLAEAACINKSLMVLRQCIDKLRRCQRFGSGEQIPYRDAKLTLLFKNFFEGSGKIRMIICANPKPADFEENLNVLAFAEESQTVRIARADDRLDTIASSRPPVPRRFYSCWNYEIDNVIASSNVRHVSSSSILLSDFNIKDYNDSASIAKLKERCLAMSQISIRENQDTIRDGELLLRNALCLADYNKLEIEQLRARLRNCEEQNASYSAENRKLKREVHSLRERLQRYEEQDEQMLTVEEQLRRSVKEERSRAMRQDQKLKVIHDICEAASPSVAQLRSKFSAGASIPSSSVAVEKRKVTTANQIEGTSRVVGPQHGDVQTPTSGPGFFNPKYHRRSKSAPRILDHQPANRVPTGGVLRVKLPTNTKQVTKPEPHQLQKSSDYVLTHQEVDQDGNISTSIVKGECIPTAGGGTAVLFNDVEQVSHRTPGRELRSFRSVAIN
uniref:Kinesin-like protein n=1 Tax=Angiostrongylus cantonensis TaxID=6313 RepID=A0A0K0D9W9_ANGCA